MIGRSLLHYQFLEKLGQGGMGEVYRARDTRLNRSVAIKVLSPDGATGSGSQKRFLKEAQAASALSHPHIATVHEIGCSEGLDFMVMEFVEGRPLGDLIGRNGMPQKDVLRYAVQIADALGTAHRAGIVHRDLKPTNVMVTPEGKVKLIDFGIAQRIEQQAGSEAATQTVELAQEQLTSSGKVVGTVAYMSPEQLSGGKVDARSDIFSFSAVLYEMATGRRAFQGTSTAATAAAILRDHPPLEGAIAGRFPPDLARIVERGLRKDPARRYQSIEDVRVELEDILEKPGSGVEAAQRPAALQRRRLSWLGAVLAATGLIAGVAAGWLLWRDIGPRPGSGPRLTLVTPDLEFATEPAPSPDGKLVVYAADPDSEGKLNLWVRQLAGGPAVRITTDPFDNHDPAFSPDGSRIVFRSERDNGTIFVVPALGGDPLLIARSGNRPRFSPDGRWVLYWQTSPGSTWGKVFVVPTSGGSPHCVSTRFVDAHQPVWSPDSTSVLFCGTPADQPGGADYHDWYVLSLKDETATRTGAFEVLGKLGLRPTRTFLGDWGEEGILFSVLNDDNQDLWNIKLSGGKVRGAPRRLTTGAGHYSDPLFAGGGRIVFTNGTDTETIWSLPADGDFGKVKGPPQPLTPGAAWKEAPSVSADGRLVAFASVGTGISGDDIFVLDNDARKVRPLTNTPVREYYPVLTRDGRRVAYRVNEHDRTDRPIYGMSSAGGERELICQNGDRPTSWSPDGRKLLLMTGGPKVVNLLDVASHTIRQYLGAPGWDCRHAKFSPDGRWVAFVAARVGTPSRPFVVPYIEGSTPKESDWIAVTEQDVVESDIDWSPNGRLVYFATRANGRLTLCARHFEPSSGILSGAPFPVYTFSDVRRPPPRSFPIAVARDKIVFSLENLTSEVWLLTP